MGDEEKYVEQKLSYPGDASMVPSALMYDGRRETRAGNKLPWFRVEERPTLLRASRAVKRSPE